MKRTILLALVATVFAFSACSDDEEPTGDSGNSGNPAVHTNCTLTLDDTISWDVTGKLLYDAEKHFYVYSFTGSQGSIEIIGDTLLVARTYPFAHYSDVIMGTDVDSLCASFIHADQQNLVTSQYVSENGTATVSFNGRNTIIDATINVCELENAPYSRRVVKLKYNAPILNAMDTSASGDGNITFGSTTFDIHKAYYLHTGNFYTYAFVDESSDRTVFFQGQNPLATGSYNLGGETAFLSGGITCSIHFDEIETYAQSGTLSVTKNGDDYTIQFSGTALNGYQFSGNYSGIIEAMSGSKK